MINYSLIRPGNRVVIWTRVSTQYQEDNGGSLASQKEICEKLAKERGYQIVKYFGGQHESAKTPGKMIKAMVDYVKRDHSIAVVIISEFDRFSRVLWQATKMLEEMRQLGIIVVAAKFGLDTRTKEGLLMAQQTLSMAQWDNQNRTDKFVSGRVDCMKAGAWIEKAPLGYFKEGKSRETYCYLNDNGKLISQAFQWKLHGMSNMEIIQKLGARGLHLSKQSLHKILVNPFYAGKIRHKFTQMELIDGRIEPAVAYEDFLKIQEILSGKTGIYTHKKEDDLHPLKGYVHCNTDGKPFTAYTTRKKLKTRIQEKDYYKCNEKGCKTNVSAEEMHSKYEELLKGYELSEDILSAFGDYIQELMNSFNGTSQEETTKLKKHLSEIERDIMNAKMRYASGKIDDDTFSVVIQEFNNRRDVILLELEKWNVNLSNLRKRIPTIIATASHISDLWHNGNLDIKKKIQKLIFPDGIFWDKEIRNYRTKNRNSVFELMDRFSMTYGNQKGTASLKAVPLCGRRDSNPYALGTRS